MKKNPIVTIICGHYGSGKTNLTLNLAIEAKEKGEMVTVVDMDIVNPYFRSSEYKNLLEEKGIELIAPSMANSTLDAPYIPPSFYSVFNREDGHVFIDVGGDDAGALVLGRFSGEVKNYEMIYVVNKYRSLSATAKEAVKLLREIEISSRLTATAIVNNSHLGVDTTLGIVKASLLFANEVSKLTALPLLYTTIPEFSEEKSAEFKEIKRLVLFPWEMEENI